MKVVLLQDIKGTGKKDQIVEVADGYARNYMFPRKLATSATAETMNAVQNRQKAIERRKAEEEREAQEMAAKIDEKSLIIHAKAGSGDRLFGSVTSKEIAAALLEATGCDIDRRKFQLEQEIKSYGSYTVGVKVYAGISAKIYVVVCE